MQRQQNTCTTAKSIMGFRRRRNQGENTLCSSPTLLFLLSVWLVTPLPLVLSHCMIWPQRGYFQSRSQPPHRDLSTPEILCRSSTPCWGKSSSRNPPRYNTVDVYSQLSLLCTSWGRQLQAEMCSGLGLISRWLLSTLWHVCVWAAAAGVHQLPSTSKAHLFPTPAHPRHVGSLLGVFIRWKSANGTNLGIFFLPLQS